MYTPASARKGKMMKQLTGVISHRLSLVSLFLSLFLSFSFAIPLMTTYFIRRFIYQLYIQSSCLVASFAMRMQQSSETILLTVLKYLVRILISPTFRIPTRTARDYTHHHADTYIQTHTYIHTAFFSIAHHSLART